MKGLISGAGIAGLATGIALRQEGYDVEIFERMPQLREIGAGLMIWPNGSRSLQALRVGVKALAVDRISFCTWRGSVVFDLPVDEIAKRYGSNVAFVHRADFKPRWPKPSGEAVSGSARKSKATTTIKPGFR